MKNYTDIISDLFNTLPIKEKSKYEDVSKIIREDLRIKEFILLLNDISLKKYSHLKPKIKTTLTKEDYINIFNNI